MFRYMNWLHPTIMLSFWGTLLKAVPAIATAAGSLFGKSKEGGGTAEKKPMMPEWQGALGKQLGGWLQDYLKQYTPGEAYGGEFVAPKTGAETKGLEVLNQFLQEPATGDVYGQAKQHVMDTLTGKYADPSTSPYIQSMSKIADRTLQETIDKARLGQGARGKFFSSKALEEETDLRSRTQDYLNALVGDFINKERGRMLETVPVAQQLEQYGRAEAPLEQVAASQTYGALDRTLTQAQLESQYQDWIRGREEKGAIPSLAANLYGKQPSYGIKKWQEPYSYETNTFGRIMKAIPSATEGVEALSDIFK